MQDDNDEKERRLKDQMDRARTLNGPASKAEQQRLYIVPQLSYGQALVRGYHMFTIIELSTLKPVTGVDERSKIEAIEDYFDTLPDKKSRRKPSKPSRS